MDRYNQDKPEADFDSIEVRASIAGQMKMIVLNANANVSEEVERIIREANLDLDARQHTIFISDNDGTEKRLDCDGTIDEETRELKFPFYVEIVRSGEQPIGPAAVPMSQLNIHKK